MSVSADLDPMKFTVERLPLVKMLEMTGKKVPAQKRRDQHVHLFACSARVFVEANESIAGTEALVLEDGSCLVPHDMLLKLIRTYHPKKAVTMESDGQTLKFGSTTLPVSGYSTDVRPPAKFQVFPVMDTGIAGKGPSAGRENQAN